MTPQGHPALLKDPQAILGGSVRSLYSSITIELRQGGDSRGLLSYTSLVMAQVHHVSLGNQKTEEPSWAGLLCVSAFLLTVPDVILGLGKAQRHLKQSGLPRLESLE